MPSPNLPTPFRLTLTGQTAELPLDHDISPNYVVVLKPGTNSIGADANRSNEHFARPSGDPFGNLDETTAANVIKFTRNDNAPASEVEISGYILESNHPTDPEDPNYPFHPDGFMTRGVEVLTMTNGVGTASVAHSGVVDPDQCQVFLGGTDADATATYKKCAGLPRVRHTATHIEAERNYTQDAVNSTVYLIEWGANVSVQLVEHVAATMTAGGDLADAADWEPVPITTVTASESWVHGSFMSKGAATPGNGPESLVCLLGNGVDQNATESTIAVGSYEGGKETKGWIYVTSCPSWFISRSTFAHGALVAAGVTSANFDLPAPPAGTVTYENSGGVEKAIGSRIVEFQATCQSEFTSEFRLAQAAVVPISNLQASYHRSIADKSDPYGTGFAAVQQVDFLGSPYGDPNDLSTRESTASLDRVHSVVADGVDKTTMTVVVKDSASKIVPGATVEATLEGGDPQVSVANASGIATFEFTSTDAGLLSVTVVLGDSPGQQMPASALVVFAEVPTNHNARPGVNLGLIQDWSACQPFTDIFLGGRGGSIKVRDSGDFHVKAKEDYDSDGWQKSCTTSEDLNYVLVTNGVGSRKAGNHVAFYAGGGWAGFTPAQVKLVQGAVITENIQGRIDFTWDGVSDLFFQVRPTTGDMTAANYVRDIVVLHEDDVADYDRSVNIWRQEFLDSLEGFKVLRFMDWGQTNNSAVSSWSQRPLTTTSNVGRWLYDDDFPDTERHIGIPYEWMIDLCNRLTVDPWINLKHLADKAYVQSEASLFKNGLNDGLVTYVEFSNEMSWNPLFRQTDYREDLRIGYGLPDTNDDRMRAYAIRACECFSYWDEIYGTQLHKRIRVLAGQSGNPSTATTIAGADVSPGDGLTGIAGDHADCYAIAPYYGRGVDEATAEAAFAAMVVHRDAIFHPTTGDVALTKANIAAVAPHLKVICYEGGQHLLVGTNLTEALLKEVNEMPEMRDFVRTSQEMCDAILGPTLFAYFSHMFKPSDKGAWGALTSIGAHAEPPGPNNFKFLGLKDWINSSTIETDVQVLDRGHGRSLALRITKLGPGESVDLPYEGWKACSFGVRRVLSGSFTTGDLQLVDVSDGEEAFVFPAGAGYQEPAETVNGFLRRPTSKVRMTNSGTATLQPFITYMR